MGVCDMFKTRRRYIAYFTIIFNFQLEAIARYGIPIAMIGGMVKQDCADPTDTGDYCWSEDVEAQVLGAYFYGYTLQLLVTIVIKRYVGFSVGYTAWLVVSGAIQFLYPVMAGYSPTLLVISQVVRGLAAGVMVPFSYDYLARFGVGNESKTVISLFGTVAAIGSGTGVLICGLIVSTLDWRWYFYFIGGVYTLGLGLHLLFVHQTPHQAWYLGEEERQLVKAATESNAEGNIHASSRKISLKQVYCRLYLVSFCVYMSSFILMLYSTLNIMPFYLHEVLGASASYISYLNLALNLAAAVLTMVFSWCYQALDRYLEWIQCRMLFTLLPMLAQVIIYGGLIANTSLVGASVLVLMTAVPRATLFSGSIGTINYEMDPENSALLFAAFNSAGQAMGFISPLLMAGVTYTPRDTPDYAAVLRTRWGHFFYIVGGSAVVSMVAIVATYLLRPGEWVLKQRKVPLKGYDAVQDKIVSDDNNSIN